MPNIVVSYRREDSQWIAGRVFDHLEAHFGKGNVFMDIDSIPFGLDFREHIQNTLNRCDILVAVIGPRWLDGGEQGRARIQEETDWVRIEIEAALSRKIPVIPILIDRTRMPKPSELPLSVQNLAFRQAADVDSGRDFRSHMDRLIRSMDELLNRIATIVPASPAEQQFGSQPAPRPIPHPTIAQPLADLAMSSDSRPALPKSADRQVEPPITIPEEASSMPPSALLALTGMGLCILGVALLMRALVIRDGDTAFWGLMMCIAGGSAAWSGRRRLSKKATI